MDFYGRSGDRSFNRLCVLAGLKSNFIEPDEDKIVKVFRKVFDINSRRFIRFIVDLIEKKLDITTINNDEEQKLMLNMMYYTFYTDIPQKIGFDSIAQGIESLLKNKVIMEEVCQILNYNYNRLNFIDKNVYLGFVFPFDLNCNYSSAQILSALGYSNETRKPNNQSGVLYVKEKKLDVFFVTLNKSEKEFSPSTLYEDYAINEVKFHWQSQSDTSTNTPVGIRYINHKQLNSKVVLFVRENKKDGSYTYPFTYLGTCEYRSHSGDKPISFVWELHEEIPASMINKANKSIII